MGKRTGIGVATALAAGLAGITAGAWRATTLLGQVALLPAPAGMPRLDLLVTAVEEGSVKLRALDPRIVPLLEAEETFALVWDGGRARVTSKLGSAAGVWTRAIEPMAGHALPTPGMLAALDQAMFYGDPESEFGLPFNDIPIETPRGAAPAWHVPAESDAWCIVVHGKGADRREALRILPALHRSAFHTLVISYSNDPGAPLGPRGHYGYGEYEWPDLEAAIAWAESQGARRIVLVGFSMGAAISLAFLRESERRNRVRGLVMEAPMLSFGETVELRAADRGVPSPIVDVGKRIAAYRFGVDWAFRDYHSVARDLQVPVLLFHGDRDDIVPVVISDRFAEQRPDIHYERVPGALHMGCWNADPERYEGLVTDFLARLP